MMVNNSTNINKTNISTHWTSKKMNDKACLFSFTLYYLWLAVLKLSIYLCIDQKFISLYSCFRKPFSRSWWNNQYNGN
jgi:hypothetical protein